MSMSMKASTRRQIIANPQEHHPSVVAAAEKHAASIQIRVADAITNFAGSMKFVYVHVALFAIWMLFIEKNPWPTLTMAVSLEAIFLSTFVMIGQNRQAAFQQAKADNDFASERKELGENTALTREVHKLVQHIDELTCRLAQVDPEWKKVTDAVKAEDVAPDSSN